MPDAFLTSVAVVALAEIGDKTQLLAILLATRFRRPWPVVAGILVATMANHFLAALLGAKMAGLLDGAGFRYAVALSFIAMAGWTLIPDTADDAAPGAGRFGAFLATVVAFFVVEIGDKTQIATIALGARFHSVLAVMAGTTLGMMLANVPAVFLGEALIARVPLRLVRILAAGLLLAVGLWLLLETAGLLTH
ncbi:TMEM165/GDT1 family protein [Novosphingobium piscinae]|uniref:GDT1 family protein n=1 Tax=Novosphingobium piscinae TaxID=1507448 RepID=A0A7X1G034_9SPHN|nr:TMEM165/GDT1 family protein [Novosphingobium piscinae]MBC2670029.1 TMEM165/GDT1 family protein [Novosphingobium piscinae]